MLSLGVAGIVPAYAQTEVEPGLPECSDMSKAGAFARFCESRRIFYREPSPGDVIRVTVPSDVRECGLLHPGADPDGVTSIRLRIAQLRDAGYDDGAAKELALLMLGSSSAFEARTRELEEHPGLPLEADEIVLLPGGEIHKGSAVAGLPEINYLSSGGRTPGSLPKGCVKPSWNPPYPVRAKVYTAWVDGKKVQVARIHECGNVVGTPPRPDLPPPPPIDERPPTSASSVGPLWLMLPFVVGLLGYHIRRERKSSTTPPGDSTHSSE